MRDSLLNSPGFFRQESFNVLTKICEKGSGGVDGSRKTGTRMCINVGTPTWSRVRHWSAPETSKTAADGGGLSPLVVPSRPPWEVPLTLEEEFEALAALHRKQEGDGHPGTSGISGEGIGEAEQEEEEPFSPPSHSLIAARLLAGSPMAMQQKLYRLRLLALQQRKTCREVFLPLDGGMPTFASGFASSTANPLLRPLHPPSADDTKERESSHSSACGPVPEHEQQQPPSSTAVAASVSPTADAPFPHVPATQSSFGSTPLSAKTATRAISRAPASSSLLDDPGAADPGGTAVGSIRKNGGFPCSPLPETEGRSSSRASSQFSPHLREEPDLNGEVATPGSSSYESPSLDKAPDPWGRWREEEGPMPAKQSSRPSLRSRPETPSSELAPWPWLGRWCWEGGGGGGGRCGGRRRGRNEVARKKKGFFSVARLICAIATLCVALAGPAQAKICESVTLKTMKDMALLRNCTVVEGKVIIALGIINDTGLAKVPKGQRFPDLNATFPQLREITDYLMVYASKSLPTLANVFPNLAVIRGNNLLEDYALVVYKNPDLQEIGLPSLTKILNGGVRITYNSKLCYARTVDWKRLTHPDYHEKIIVKENQMQNACPELCSEGCPDHTMYEGRKSCWNENICQRVEENCPQGAEPGSVCYRTPGSGQVRECSQECVGGCSEDDPSECAACRDVLFEGDRGRWQCLARCPNEFLKFQDWRCITKTECRSKSIRFSGESIQDTNLFKSYDNKCLATCPGNTREEFDTDGTPICVECQDCPKKCNGDLITSFAVLNAFKDCTHIVGDLTIQLTGSNVVQQLEQYLGKVKEITGGLKISRTYALVSLDFFRNLQYIRGKNKYGDNKYSLTILENENLQKLFPVREDGSTVRVLRTDDDGSESDGNAFIHYNARLCKEEIKSLIRNSGLEDPGENSPDISYATNGGKAICGSRKLKVELQKVDSNIALIQWENYKQTIKDVWQEANVRTLLGYKIHYREISEATFRAQNMTKYDGRDACGGDDWVVLDQTPTTTLEKDEESGMLYWPPEFLFLSPLLPYSYYAIFISTLLVKEYAGSEGVEGAESDIIYFHTPEDIPKPPTEVRVRKTSYSSFNLTWEPPEVPNGIIDHYEIVLTLNEINAARLMDRPYCKESMKATDMAAFDKKEEEEKEKAFAGGDATLANVTSSADGTCDCATCGGVAVKKNNGIKAPSQKMQEEFFFDAVLNVVFDAQSSSSSAPVEEEEEEGGRVKRSVEVAVPKRWRRSVGDAQGKEKQRNAILLDSGLDSEAPDAAQGKNETEEEDDGIEVEEDGLERYRVMNSKMGGLSEPMPYSEAQRFPDGRKIYKVFAKRVPGDQRSLFVRDLKHYGGYTISVRACQAAFEVKDDMFMMGEGSSTEGAVKKKEYMKFCSMDVVKEERVLHKPGADDITSKVRTISQNDTNRVWLSWDPPSDPNELILNYVLELKSKQESAGSIECVTAKQFEDAGRRFRPDRTGSYYVRVRAVSLRGEGNWTDSQWITVPSEASTMIVAIVVPIVVVSLALIAAAAAYQYKRSKDHIPDGGVVSVNPNYWQLGELYQADEWEVDRHKVVIGEELGRGAFGKVHKGTFDDQENGVLVECAIKTVREGASHTECLEFLNEAQTMKAFKTEHVVRLIGVVSRCQPHLVLLELMENEDLKTYLRSLRPDVEPGESNRFNRLPPSFKEVKQMALEISDGMAYLSTHEKHIVHRDLAARNCMVSRDIVVKIGDFGMAREIYTTDYYKKGDKGMMPVRWMAPESLRDGRATSSSDVWSFGVVLWEMVTLAELPYQGYSNEQVVDRVKKGHIMPSPPGCPDDLYGIMTDCWQKRESRRPSFLDLCERLLPIANDRFRERAFFTSEEGRAMLERQTEDRRIAQEEMEAQEDAQAAAAQEEEEEEEDAGNEETNPFLHQGQTPSRNSAGGGGGGHVNGQHNSNSNGDAYSTSATTTENGHVPPLANSASAADMRAFNRQTSNSSAPPPEAFSSTSRTPAVVVINEGGTGLRSVRSWMPNGLRTRLRNLSGSAIGGGGPSSSMAGGRRAGGNRGEPASTSAGAQLAGGGGGGHSSATTPTSEMLPRATASGEA